MEEICKKPSIRFSGFTDYWEQCDFKDLAKVRRGLTYKPKDVQKKGVIVLRSSNINEDTFELRSDDIFVNQSALNIKSVDENDILITSANGSSRLVGKHALIKNITGLAVHGGFMLLATSEEPYFTNAFMSSSWYSRFIHIYVSGGNGAIGNLSKSDLDSQKIYIPKQFEQQQIGALFNSLDNLITLHQRKLKEIESLKKTLLNKLFPSNGKKIPDYRFTSFNEDWEQRKLKSVLKERNVKEPENIDYPLMSFVQGQGVVPKGDRYDRSFLVMDNQKKYKRTELGDFIYSSNNLETGSIGFNKEGKASISPVYSIFSGVTVIDSKFIGYLSERKEFINKMIRFRQGVMYGQWRIHEKDFLSIGNRLPSNEEMSKIVSIMERIDNNLTLHQRKTEQLELLKKYLLKNMFV